jgi:hypothetical protein
MARLALTRVFRQDGEALIALVLGYVQFGASEKVRGRVSRHGRACHGHPRGSAHRALAS